jgi:hypothetical protein
MTRADPTANLPPAQGEPDARGRIRRALADAGRRIAVLDDDPTGSQTVHGVDVVTVVEPDELAAGLAEAGSTCFILTNTRSLAEADAVELNTRIGRMLFELADRLEAPIDVVSRSDSTLRGHVIAEVRALDAARREATGRGLTACCWRRRTVLPAWLADLHDLACNCSAPILYPMEPPRWRGAPPRSGICSLRRGRRSLRHADGARLTGGLGGRLWAAAGRSRPSPERSTRRSPHSASSRTGRRSPPECGSSRPGPIHR